jgi:hypothetical protein
MPHRLYRRCPGCLEAGPGVPCGECQCVGFIPAGITEDDLASFRRRTGELREVAGSIQRLISASRNSRQAFPHEAN